MFFCFSFTQRNCFLLFSLFIVSIPLRSQSAFCEDPDTFTTECGTVFDLCIDYEELDETGVVDIYVNSNDDIGIFDPCDLKLPLDPELLPKRGTVSKVNQGGNCFMRYTLTVDGYVGLDSFDYLLNHVDVCNIPTDYCPGGKIWTINSAYYGEDGAAVTIEAKEGGSKFIFATIYDLESGKDFFVNGKDLAVNQTEWTFRFYSN